MTVVQSAPYFRTSIVPADLRVQMKNGDVLYISNVERIWGSKVNKRITVRNVNGEVLRFQVEDASSWVMIRTSNSTIKVLHERHSAFVELSRAVWFLYDQDYEDWEINVLGWATED